MPVDILGAGVIPRRKRPIYNPNSPDPKNIGYGYPGAGAQTKRPKAGTPGSPGGPVSPGPADPNSPTAPGPKVNPFSLDDSDYYRGAKADALRMFGLSEDAILNDKTHLLLGLGDRDLAAQWLGSGYAGLGSITDDPNSTSILGQINRGYNQTVKADETQLRQHNLSYGGKRGETLRNLAFEKGKQRSGAIGQAQSALAQIQQRDLAAQQARDDAIRNAASTAWAQWAAANGYN